MVWRRTFEVIKRRFGWHNDSDWILTDKTQFEEPTVKGRKLQLVIGLDFGTAFTKVVIGEQRVRYAVPFGVHANRGNPYLLPSALSIVGEGQECLPGLNKEAKRVIDDLKMRLINRDFSVETKVHCIAFIALVLRYVRGWLLNTHRSTYKDRQIVWLLNIGLPTDSYHDQELVSVYHEIAYIAWTVSILPGPISLKRVEHYVGKGPISVEMLPPQIGHRLLDSQYISEFPEFAVQLLGYVRSSRRQPGLHALLDIGAGTADFTTFNVWRVENGEDAFPIFAKDVKPLGTRFLIEHRLAGHEPKNGWNPSPYDDVPDDQVFEDKLSLRPGQLQELDAPFRNEVEVLIRRTLVTTKTHRDPQSEHWESGVPTFLCGGGSHVKCYVHAVHSLEAARPPCRIVPASLPIPDDLQAPGLPKGTYDRVSVAYGLAHAPEDIGRIRPVPDVPDVRSGDGPPPRDPYEDRYVDKDQV